MISIQEQIVMQFNEEETKQDKQYFLDSIVSLCVHLEQEIGQDE